MGGKQQRFEAVRLAEVVKHRTLILPQLGAPGVAAHEVKKGTGFSVKYGPVRATDLGKYLDAGMKATPAMREVFFTLGERFALTPVELMAVRGKILWAILVAIVVSGFGPEFWSFGPAFSRGLGFFGACFTGLLAGAVVTPVLLPWVPGAMFTTKGTIVGSAAYVSSLTARVAEDRVLREQTFQSLLSGLAASRRLLSERRAGGVLAEEGSLKQRNSVSFELNGRAVRAETQPDMDLDVLRAAIQKAVVAIQDHQSTSGGWWYTQGEKHQHEGSTTVCAVQALVSAKSYGFEVDQAVLDNGFEYLKKCQNSDGGFDYKLGDASSMKEGTAAGVATLALMKRMDYGVMIDGVGFLTSLKPDGLATQRFPYYGWFYGTMGMRLYGEEMAAEETTDPWIARSHELLTAWQAEDGSFPMKGWMASSSAADGPYSTAFGALVLTVPDGRLSIFNRTPPTPVPSVAPTEE